MQNVPAEKLRWGFFVIVSRVPFIGEQTARESISLFTATSRSPLLLSLVSDIRFTWIRNQQDFMSDNTSLSLCKWIKVSITCKVSTARIALKLSRKKLLVYFNHDSNFVFFLTFLRSKYNPCTWLLPSQLFLYLLLLSNDHRSRWGTYEQIYSLFLITFDKKYANRMIAQGEVLGPMGGGG